MNAKMPELKRCFEAAGFTDVRTVLASGNVAFTTRASAVEALARRAETAMDAELGRRFLTIVRPAQYLQGLVDPNPFAEFDLAPAAKRVITFLRRAPEPAPDLPIEIDGACILKVASAEVFTAYVAGEKGPVFMGLLERTFGADITTRTLDTVRRCAGA